MKRIQVAAPLFSFILLVVLAGFFVVAYQRVSYPFQYGYGEGPIIDQIWRLVQGQPVYGNPFSGPPWRVSNYPPVFHFAVAPLFHLFGPSFWATRAVSIVSILFCGLVLWKIVALVSSSKVERLVATTTFFSAPMIVYWGTQGRVDSLALLFFLLAVLLTLKIECSDGKWWWMVSVSAVLAIFTRQSFLFAALFFPLAWFVLNKKSVIGIKITLATLSLVVSLFFALQITTDGLFELNVIQSNMNRFDFNSFYTLLVQSFSLQLFFVIACLVCLLRLKDLPPQKRKLLVVVCIASAPSLFAMAKVGAAWNYLFEAQIAISLGVAFFLSTAVSNKFSRVFLALFALQTLFAVGLPFTLHGQRDLNSAEVKMLVDLQKQIQNSDQPILTDALLGIEALTGKQMLYQPFIMNQLYFQNQWDDTELVDMIGKKQFFCIIVESPDALSIRQERWTPNAWSAIKRHYRRGATIGRMVVFWPL